MGKFKYLVDIPALIEIFKEKYHIPQEINLRYYPLEGIAFDQEMGEVVIPMIAFIEGGMILPMGRITRDYLCNHRLCPHQCAPNLFRILGAVDTLNQHLRLGLTWLDVVHLYEGHKQKRVGFYLKSRSKVVKLISCLPKSNKGMKDDYLIASGPWHDGFPCPTQLGEPVGYPRIRFFNIRFKIFVLGFVLLYIYIMPFYFYVNIFLTKNSRFLTV